jgi:hypothetical protein
MGFAEFDEQPNSAPNRHSKTKSLPRRSTVLGVIWKEVNALAEPRSNIFLGVVEGGQQKKSRVQRPGYKVRHKSEAMVEIRRPEIKNYLPKI